MDVRWPGVLRSELGEGYHVIEEGLGGRTTVWDDEIEEHRNGKTYLYPCIESHAPLDLVIIFLGTNDLKYRFHLGAFDIAESVGKLVDIVRRSDAGTGGRAPGVLVTVRPSSLRQASLLRCSRMDERPLSVFERNSRGCAAAGGFPSFSRTMSPR
jgi:lysophospholipase L1-like esterase